MRVQSIRRSVGSFGTCFSSQDFPLISTRNENRSPLSPTLLIYSRTSLPKMEGLVIIVIKFKYHPMARSSAFAGER